MAIDIKFDLVGNPEPPTIILANRNGNKLGQLKFNADSIGLSDKFNDAAEVSFTVNKYIDDEIVPLWDKIVDFKLIYCKEWDVWFEIAVEFNEETESVKTVFGTQLGYAELSQIMLYDIEINTEKDIERDDYKITILYDPEDSQASLLNRIFEKAPHYSVIHVDSTIANIQRSFSFNDTSIVDACGDIAEEIGCLFKFHSNSDDKGMPQRTVSVYDLYQNCNNCGHRGEFTDKCPECNSTDIKYGYGDDTTIFVTSDELASNGIELTTDTDEVKNCFKLEAGDDLMTATVRNCNPNGTDYIWYFSDSLKEDMSDELVKKLDSYDVLYKEYYSVHKSKLNTKLVEDYNRLVKKYESYYNATSTCLNCKYEGMFKNLCPQCDSENILTGKTLQSIPTTIEGYSALMNAYYNVIDLGWYLKSSLMPTVRMSKTSAEEQADLLRNELPSSVAVADASITSEATANSAILGIAKIIVKSTYKVQIKNSEYSKSTKIWKGNFTITNYSDDTDSADTVTISVTINDELESFIRQKIDKALNKEDTEDLSITGLFKKDIADFKSELKKYALVPLNSFYDACQACIDILIEQGVADIKNDLYTKLYKPYYDKLVALEAEMKTREDELNIIIGVYDANDELTSKGMQQEIEECKNAIQKILNFQDYMGEDLWLEFCTYRREDKYSNDNYISDGLNNAELFDKALEFYKVAENEIYKSAELQHSISATLNNLLAIEKFKPLVKSFNVGNWLRVRIDDKVYKLRLLEYEIDFGDFDNISVEFSDITKIKNGITDVESVFSQASSMASSYDAVVRQANKGNEARSTIREWLTEGLNTALVQIQNNVNEDIIIDRNGLLGRSYSDIMRTYSPEQIRLTHNIIAYTDDNWETVKQAIGKHKYKMYDTGVKGFVDKIGYGVSAEFVTAGIVSGSQIIGGNIYSENYSITDKEGSYINLIDGTFSFGGGALRFEGGKLLISSPDIPTTEQITEINEEWLKTTSVYAENLNVSAAKINGKLTADQIDANGLDVNVAEIGNWKVGTDGYDAGSLYSDNGDYRAWMHTPGYGSDGADLWVYSIHKKSNGENIFYVTTAGNLYVSKSLGVGSGDIYTNYGNIKAINGNVTAGKDITASGNMNATNITASNTMKTPYIEVSNKATFAGGTYINSKGGMIFPESTSWIGYDGAASFASGNVSIGTDGKLTASSISTNSINNYLEVSTHTAKRMTLGIMNHTFPVDGSTPAARDTIRSAGGLVVSANTGSNGLFLEGSGIYLVKGKNSYIATAGAIGVDGDGKIKTMTSSSKRYKENITEDYNEKLNPENLYKIPVKQFNYKDEYRDITFNPNTQLGLIAEDVDKYFPSACCYNQQGQVEGWHDRMVIPAMLKLIQNQKLSIDSLCQKCEDLSKEFDAIKSKVNE